MTSPRKKPKLVPKKPRPLASYAAAAAAVAALAAVRWRLGAPAFTASVAGLLPPWSVSTCNCLGELPGAAAWATCLSTLADASSRLSAPPNNDEAGCKAAQLLWWGGDCAGFLLDHWERVPLLSRPGPNFASELLSLADVPKLLAMWPFRIQKNHGTVVVHEPASGFLASPKWARGDAVPPEMLREVLDGGRTFVVHNLEVYWPPITQFARQLTRFFHSYVQVNLYVSPAHLDVATSPHQDSHSVFIVQLSGAKRWMVHAPRTPLTPKGLQRGKQGDVLRAGDEALMGPAVVNATLRRGDALYVPRAFFHHTSTSVGDSGGGEPSAALTFSILSEDVYATWLFLLGEAVETLPGGARAARALQRQAAAQPGGAIGVRLREALPRQLLAPPPPGAALASNGSAAWAGWRCHALALLADALKADGGGTPVEWGDAALLDALDAALARKRIPRALKLAQIDAFLSAMEARDRGGGGLLGELGVLDVDIDAIFKIEKADKSWMPAQRAWYNAREWA